MVGLLGLLFWRRSLKTLLPFVAPSSLLEPAEELRAPRLVAAALADELVLQRVEGVDVVSVHGAVDGLWIAM